MGYHRRKPIWPRGDLNLRCQYQSAALLASRRFPERSPQKKKTQKKAHRKNAHKEKCPQGNMPTGKYAHREKCPARKNAHMYNSFKIVTGMSAFIKKYSNAEGNITKSKDRG